MSPEADAEPQTRPLVTIIDPCDKHREHLRRALNGRYSAAAFQSAGDAVRALATIAVPALILLDERTSSSGGTAGLETVWSDPLLRDVPVVGLAKTEATDFVRALRARGCLVLIKPFPRDKLLMTITSSLTQSIEAQWDTIEPVQRSALKKTVAIFNEVPNLILEGKPIPYSDVRDSCACLVEAVRHRNFDALLDSVKGHDNYTYVHSIRVATFLSHFGHELGLRGDDLLTLATGGLLHDIGKVSIPQAVLNKPGRLNEEEVSVMRGHVVLSVDMLDHITDVPRGVATIAAQHHEKVDGTGYPRGLKGGALNDLARMAAIVDVFGALTDRRVYKDPMPPEAALDLMTEMQGHLDQRLVRLFRDMLLDAASALRSV